MEKTGRYLELLRGGLFLMTLGLGLFINFQPYIDWPRIILFLGIVGIGFGPNFHAPLIALQTRLQPADVAAGTATFGFVRMLSGAIGVVLGQVIFQSQMQIHNSDLLGAGVSPDVVANLAKGSAISSTTGANSSDLDPAIRLAKTESFSKMWILYTLISAMGLLASMGIRKVKLSREHEEFRTGLTSSGSEGDSISKSESKSKSEDMV